jgi:hypothetical protein
MVILVFCTKKNLATLVWAKFFVNIQILSGAKAFIFHTEIFQTMNFKANVHNFIAFFLLH